jgi:hypothetical protein
MKHTHVTTYQPDEGLRAGHDLHGQRPVPHVSRPNSAPAYYLGRPASLWINVMKPRRRRIVAGHLAGAAA